jgi:hypothetical protein
VPIIHIRPLLALAGQRYAEPRQHDDHDAERHEAADHDPRMPGFAHGRGKGTAEEDQHGADKPGPDHEHGQEDDEALGAGGGGEEVHYHEIVPDATPSPDANYSSGNDYIVEFLGYRFSFGEADFEGRVVAAAVKLGVVESPELDEDEIADLVALAAQGVIDEPASRLGSYLVRHWERVSLVGGESLVYWLRKLIFRGAWLDHQVKRGALEVVWDDGDAEFAYQHPGGGGRPLLELAPVPSWHELQFKQP